MKIEHIGLWVRELEEMKQFYCTYFQATANDIYHNPSKGFSSYFLTFESGARLELMMRSDITNGSDNVYGFTHLAMSLGSQSAVDDLLTKLIKAGCTHIDGPRITGDGYYEAVVMDPEGNRIELTI